MRKIFHLLAISASLVSVSAVQAQSKGIFRPAGADPAPWEINEFHTLVWNGQPYIPVGVRINGTPEEIASTAKAGVKDVIVRLSLTANWNAAIKELEAQGMRYVICLDTLAPTATGTIVDPQRIRLANVAKSGDYTLNLPGASNSLAVLIGDRDGTPEDPFTVKVADGVFTYHRTRDSVSTFTLYAYPNGDSLGQIDCWEKFDEHRDRILAKLKGASFGPGLRGILNPLGETVAFRNSEGVVLPTSVSFRVDLATYLETRYRSVSTAVRAWGLSTNDIEDFESLAQLAPLWQGNRGASMFWNPVTDHTYRCAPRQSAAWTDIWNVLDAALARRTDRLVRAIHRAVDVPVVQEWKDWAGPFELQNPSVSGMAFKVNENTITGAISDGAGAASTVYRWKSNGWLIASSIPSLPPNSPTPGYAPADVLAELSNLGTRGFYFSTAAPQDVATLQPESGLGSWCPRPIFFPDNARYPAAPQRLPGSCYWLPSPSDGNSIDLGVGYNAYRYQYGDQKFIAMWSTKGAVKTRLRMVDTKNAVFTSLDGTNPQPKAVRGGVEVIIPEFPILITGIDEIPVPEPAMVDTVARFDAISKIAKAQNRDITTETYTFKEAVQGFDRNPGGSMATMRGMYWRATARVAPYVFIEGEASRTNTFSDLGPAPGASGNVALLLRTLGAGSFSAEYNVPVKSDEDQTVWVAAKVADRDVPSITVFVSGQALRLEKASPIYGSGFAWYKAGVTQLHGTTNKLVVQVDCDHPTAVAIDAIFISPEPYEPLGNHPPELIRN